MPTANSAAEAYDGRVHATILTGSGDDAITVVRGMPGAIARAALATTGLPLDDIPKALLDSAARRAPVRTRAARAVTS